LDKLDPITDEALKVLWEDDSTPRITGVSRIYHVVMPLQSKLIGEHRTCYASPVWADVHVDDNDYCELHSWMFFGHRPKRDGTGYFLQKPEDAIIWEAMTHVWKWLEEWEYVELRPIGPEDKEYFATDKLKEGKVVTEHGYSG
jgi:hypothetical protein